MSCTNESRHTSPVVGISGSSTETLGWEEPPDSLHLAQVHYLVRHGERTPVRTRLLTADPPIPPRWMLCHAGKQFQAAILNLQSGSHTRDSKDQIVAQDWKQHEYRGSSSHMKIHKYVESTDHNGEHILPKQSGECLLGELTDLGRASTFLIGQRLRRLYIDKLGLLPTTMRQEDEAKVYFRSTNMSRTIESLQGIVSGLLPQTIGNDFDAGHTYHPSMLVRNGVTENLLPNTFGCARLRLLDKEFAAAAAALHNPKLAQFDDAIKPHTDGKPPRVDGHPRLNGILDTVRASKAHNIPIPSIFENANVINVVERAVCDEWFGAYHAQDKAVRQQFRRLAMGRFFFELSERLNAKASRPNSTPLALALYSTHDTSLAGILNTLDVFDNKWPAFTASLGIELFKKDDDLLTKLRLKRPQHFVRMRYGDTTLKLPACGEQGKHLSGYPEFCTLQAFTDAATSLQHPQAKGWEEECSE